jgi:arsenite-activated ATPase ArsA
MNTPISELIAAATRFLFFTGKGGVGKTSLACATAISLADAGKRVLLVSTDPASNLDEVLGTSLNGQATAIPGAPSLFALNIDPEEAARAYREKIVGPMRGVLPEAALRSMEEQLSGACTMEIAAFDEFSRLLGDESSTAAYDHVVFDTAPTGHTLRLLTLPKAWTGYFQANTSGTSCLGPLAGLDQQRSIYEGALNALADAGRTTLILVSRAQLAPLREAKRTHDELGALGVTNQRLVLNGVFTATDSGDGIAAALEMRGAKAMTQFRSFLGSLPNYRVPLRPNNLLGLDALRAIVSGLEGEVSSGSSVESTASDFESIDKFIADLEAPGRGVVMTMGKGGVGKTTVAAALAVELARRGHAVHLSTTDPAAHVLETLGSTVNGLSVSRIDPSAETEAYVAHVLSTQGASLDAESRALLEEDLRSPCTEEIAVFRAFARTVAEAQDSFCHPRHGTDRAHPSFAGHNGSLSSRVGPTGPREHSRGSAATSAAPARRGLYASAFGDVARGHTCSRSRRPAGRFAAGRDRAVRLGRQPKLRRSGNQRSALARTGTQRNPLPFRSRRFSCEKSDSLALAGGRTGWPQRLSQPVLSISDGNSLTQQSMTTYIYETIPASCCEDPKHYEIAQNETDAPLTHHPETGEPIKRVLLGELELTKDAKDDSCGCGPEGCC